MERPKKAVVFDYDGTLMDSTAVIVGAYQHIARKFGYTVPTEANVTSLMRLAMPAPQIAQTLFPTCSPAEVMAENARYAAEHGDKAQIFDGILDLLQTLHKKEIPMAILTGADGIINQLLKQNNIDHFFKSVVHCDRLQFSKPNPEGFLLATTECDVRPEEAIMVGDSPNDIFAGKSGGAGLTVGVSYGHGSRADLLAADPNFLAHSAPQLGTFLLQEIS
jgi:phosphoglycolate phosphatase